MLEEGDPYAASDPETLAIRLVAERSLDRVSNEDVRVGSISVAVAEVLNEGLVDKEEGDSSHIARAPSPPTWTKSILLPELVGDYNAGEVESLMKLAGPAMLSAALLILSLLCLPMMYLWWNYTVPLLKALQIGGDGGEGDFARILCLGLWPVTMVRATGKWLQAQGHFHPSLIASVIMWIANPLLWLWPKLLATSPIKYAGLIFTANAP
eukprot:gene9519-2820_t